MSFNKKQLPVFCEWKMMREGLYVLGLEPGTALPLGRGPLREMGKLMFLEGQKKYPITISFEVVDTLEEFERIQKMASSLS